MKKSWVLGSGISVVNLSDITHNFYVILGASCVILIIDISHIEATCPTYGYLIVLDNYNE